MSRPDLPSVETDAKPNPKVGRIDLIQLLRGLAALMVAAFHLQSSAHTLTNYEGAFRLFAHGEAGVDLFFVISGFIIYYTSQSRVGLTAVEFGKARFWRIYPAYWGVLLVYLLIAGAAMLQPGVINFSYEVTPKSLVTSIFLLPLPDHIIDVAWTLAIEILFYMLFALTFFRFGKKAFFISMIVWAVLAQLVTHGVDIDHPIVGYLFYGGVVEFLFGASIAVLLTRGRIHHSKLALLLGVAGFGVWLLGGYEYMGVELAREWGAGIPSALILYGVVGSSLRLPAWVLLLGEASYILYLIHLLCLRIFANVLMLYRF